MAYIDRENHLRLLNDKSSCYSNKNTEDPFKTDIDSIITEYKSIVDDRNIEFTSTWLLEKDIWIQGEKKSLPEERGDLTRGRVVNVNPGVSRMGREQRFIHPYIVLAEHKETFIGVPITNMALDKKTGQYYLRNIFEV